MLLGEFPPPLFPPPYISPSDFHHANKTNSALADLDASGEVTDPTPAAVQSKDEQPAASASADSGVEEGEVAEAQDANAE